VEVGDSRIRLQGSRPCLEEIAPNPYARHKPEYETILTTWLLDVLECLLSYWFFSIRNIGLSFDPLLLFYKTLNLIQTRWISYGFFDAKKWSHHFFLFCINIELRIRRSIWPIAWAAYVVAVITAKNGRKATSNCFYWQHQRQSFHRMIRTDLACKSPKWFLLMVAEHAKASDFEIQRIFGEYRAMSTMSTIVSRTRWCTWKAAIISFTRGGSYPTAWVVLLLWPIWVCVNGNRLPHPLMTSLFIDCVPNKVRYTTP